MQPSEKGSSYNFYFMSRIGTAALLLYFPSSQPLRRLRLRVASAALFSVVAALHDSFRRRNLSPPPAASRFRDFIFRRRSLSSTPSVDAAFRLLLASTTSSSVVTAFRRLLPSTQPFVDSFRRRKPSSALTSSRFRDFSFRRRSQPFVLHVSEGVTDATDGRSEGR